MTREQKEVIFINPPLEGEWKFLCPPGHHPNAFDFVKYSPDRTVSHIKTKFHFLVGQVSSSDYFCWEEPVRSPVSGKVIRASDGWEDHHSTGLWKTIAIWYNATFRFRPKENDGRLDIRPNAGNHIMIEADDGFIVFLAHMKNSSILVKEGDRVEVGDRLGKVGNSGNSTAPHLHINLFDQMDDPYKAEVLPFVFKQFEVMGKEKFWVRKSLSVPAVGDFIRFLD